MAKPQDGRFQNLTVDFKTLMGLPLSHRMDMLESKRGRDLLGSIDPSLLPDLFPMHYKRDAGFARTLESLTGYRYSAQMTKEGETKLVRGEQVSEEGRRSVREGRATTTRNDTAVAIPGWMSEIQKRTGVAIDASGAGVGTLKGRSAVQKSVYDAFVKAGFSDSQSRALTAEVGRENNFEERHIFGSHSEPGGSAGVRGRPNQGMLSWGDPSRRRAFLEHMQGEGMIDDKGNIIPGQAALEAQARFVRKEMSTYNRASQAFLENRNISAKDADVALASYIGWDRAGRYINASEHIARRDAHRASLDRILAEAQFNSSQGEMPQLPAGIADKLVEEYNKMSDFQKRNFHRALDKLGNGDPTKAVSTINDIYKNNPTRTEQDLARGNVDIKYADESVRERASNLRNETTGLMQRFSNLYPGATISSTFRDPSHPIERNKRTGPGQHTRGNAFDVSTKDKSPQEVERMIQSLKQAGANRVLLGAGHLHVEYRDEGGFELGSERSGNDKIGIDRAREVAATVQHNSYEDIRRQQLEAQQARQAQTAAQQTATSVQPTTEAQAEEQPQQVEGFAYGGEMQTDAKELNAVPLDQPRTDMAVPIDKRDNMAVLDETGKTQFTMNDKEQASLQDGKVEVKTREQNRAEDVEPRSQQLESDNRQREEQQKQVTREMAQGSLSASVAEDNTISRLNQEMAGATEELFKTPSFRRAMAQRHGMKDQDATGDHFSYGSYGI